MKPSTSSTSLSQPEQEQFRSLPQRTPSAGDVVEKSSALDTDAKNAQGIDVSDEGLPNNVSRIDQLSSLPLVCLNQNPKTKKERPLRHVDEYGNVSTYALSPMTYSVFFILLVELLERFSFYGLNYTMTSFLTGAYDDLKNRSAEEERWNAEMSAIEASSMVSISTAIAYSMPFVGAVLADSFLGDYKAMLVGSLCFYLPGLLLILGSTIPHLWGLETFSRKALCSGLLVFWPVGTGIVKSIVNVFGAKQFHPLLQSALIESYYVKFYMCINIGALIGGFVVPVLAQSDITLAYTCPVVMLLVGIVLFLSGTSRYVRYPPKGDMFKGLNIFGTSASKLTKERKHESDLTGSKTTSTMSTILRISALIIPFNIAYSQMATTFIIQGTVMKRAFGWIDAASMNNADAIAVLFFGHYIGSHLYPYLNRKNIKLSTANKFALGSALGAFAIAWALYVEIKIYSQYELDGSKVSILWQTVAYVSIGAGEIFAVSAAYEAAFTVSPPEQKVLSSALNLFCVGGLPNLLCLVLYNLCSGWFVPTTGKSGNSISSLKDYVTAEVYKYFLLLFGIACLGIIINMLPIVGNYVKSVEEDAATAIKTPLLQKTPMARRKLQRKLNERSSDRTVPVLRKQASDDYSVSTFSGDTDEEASSLETSPLMRIERHKAYLKYGSGPNLYKSGSMRAGPSLSKNKNLDVERGDETKNNQQRKILLHKHQIDRLYRNTSSRTRKKKPANLVVPPKGKPRTVDSLREIK